MIINHWKNKFQILETFNSNTQILSNGSMAIYFEKTSDKSLAIHFKPINEDFNSAILNISKGILINFERDLIEEDDIEYALDIFSLFNKFPQFNIVKLPQIDKIEQLLQLLKSEYTNQFGSYIMLKTELKVLLLHLIRYQKSSFLKQDLNQKRVFTFLELMEISFLNETNTEFYAKNIGISSKRLNQILKQKLNLTAKQIIKQRQITEAKRMLIKGELTTKEIAFTLSFDSLSSFSRFFKQSVGVSPSQFKTEG